MIGPIDWTAAPRCERLDLTEAMRAPDRVAGLVRWLERARRRYGELSPALLALRPPEWRTLLVALRDHGAPHLGEVVLFAQLWAPEAMYVAYPDLAEYAALLQAGGWGPPADLPELVSIWRGGRAASVEDLRAGRSWTTDRVVASSFAIDRRLCGVPGRSLVIKATVPRSQVASLVEPIVLSEIVLHALPSVVAIDGDEAEWIMEAARFQYLAAAKMRATPGHGLNPFPLYSSDLLTRGIRRWKRTP